MEWLRDVIRECRKTAMQARTLGVSQVEFRSYHEGLAVGWDAAADMVERAIGEGLTELGETWDEAYRRTVGPKSFFADPPPHTGGETDE